MMLDVMIGAAPYDWKHIAVTYVFALICESSPGVRFGGFPGIDRGLRVSHAREGPTRGPIHCLGRLTNWRTKETLVCAMGSVC